MIFVTLGSQKFQFNRLLKEVDRLVEEGSINEEVFAQIGYSDYKPKNYNYKEFLDRKAFAEVMSKCDKVITHGGTGAIINAVKNNKKVIAIPRLKEFNEHVDNHQIEIVKQFSEMQIIKSAEDIKKLGTLINKIDNTQLQSYISNTNEIINSINEFLSI